MIHITLMHGSAARRADEWQVALESSQSIGDGLRACLQSPAINDAWRGVIDAALNEGLAISLWGRRVTLAEPLRDGDRVELSRPLLVDPKVARRERFKSQGSKSAGLFSKRRPGSKPGY